MVEKMIRMLTGLMGVIAAAESGATPPPSPQTIGWIEPVQVQGLVLDAKIDTGADSSSIAAGSVTEFERDGQPWVRFTLRHRNQAVRTLERPLIRQVAIKLATGKLQRRPVVELEICLGRQRRTTQMNLSSRERKQYPMLIGRDFLHGRFVVDPARERTTRPRCANAEGR